MRPHTSEGQPVIELSAQPSLRVALYSHDTQGLGHIRRSLCLADALAGTTREPSILICAGVAEARAFRLPAGTDLLTLPALLKDGLGRYGSRSLGGSLRDLLALRSQVLTAAILAFQPDVLVVDKVALGAMGELEPALDVLRRTGTCRVVLGLRDILDAPLAARREWEQTATTDAVRRYYDAVWVYGDRRVSDPVAEYGLPDDVAAMVSFAGYLADGRAVAPRDPLTDAIIAKGPYALCVAGGGQDGAPLARAFLDAPLPDGLRGVVLTGPFMSTPERLELEALAQRRGDRDVHTFVAEPTWLLRSAAAVAGMAGYNTVCEILQARVPAVLVPRVRPRREQQVRAERLAALGVVECVLPGELTPARLGAALSRAAGRSPDVAAIDLDAVARLPRLLADVLATRRSQEVACAAR